MRRRCSPPPGSRTFLAYSVWPSGTKGKRIRGQAETVRTRVGVDNVAAIEALAGAMGDEPDRLQVVVEIDCGARRSGAPPEAAGDLARAARKRGLVPVGVYTSRGHGSAEPGSREPAAGDQAAALTTAVRSLAAVGLTAEVVSTGSMPTVAYSAGSPVTEIRPGESVFCDLGNTRLGACEEHRIALFVAATVVSDLVPDQVDPQPQRITGVHQRRGLDRRQRALMPPLCVNTRLAGWFRRAAA